MGELVVPRPLVVVTLEARATSRSLDQEVLRRRMGVVAIRTPPHLHRVVGNGSFFRKRTDVIVTFEAQRGLPVLDQVARRALVTKIASIEHWLVDRPRQQLGVTVAVRRVTRGAFQRAHLGVQVSLHQVWILRVVTVETEIGKRLRQQRRLIGSMRLMAARAII
jgi:hypothetical protein